LQNIIISCISFQLVLLWIIIISCISFQLDLLQIIIISRISFQLDLLRITTISPISFQLNLLWIIIISHISFQLDLLQIIIIISHISFQTSPFANYYYFTYLIMSSHTTHYFFFPQFFSIPFSPFLLQFVNMSSFQIWLISKLQNKITNYVDFSPALLRTEKPCPLLSWHSSLLMGVCK
jgi:hypothetical protein